MRICILTTSFPAYKEHFQSPFIFRLADALSKHVSVDIVCPYYRESEKKEEMWGDVRIHRFQYLPRKMQTLIHNGGIPSNFRKSIYAKIQLPLLYTAMFFKAKKFVPDTDIIHAQWSLTALVGIFLKKIYKKPLVLTERGSSLNAAIEHSITKKVLVWMLKKCDYITANNFEQIEIIKRLGFTENVKAVPNGMDIEKFAPGDKLKSRETLGLPLQKKIILYVGWLVEKKGMRFLLESSLEIIKKYPDILYVLVGGGLELQNYRKYVSENGLEEYVLFTGAKLPDEIPRYMNAADIFVLPSLCEGRPNVIPEAMACGLPVIATEVNGTPEIIRNGVDGILIEPKNSKAITTMILRILTNEKFAHKLKKYSRESITKKDLNWNYTAESFLRIYKGIR